MKVTKEGRMLIGTPCDAVDKVKFQDEDLFLLTPPDHIIKEMQALGMNPMRQLVRSLSVDDLIGSIAGVDSDGVIYQKGLRVGSINELIFDGKELIEDESN